MTADVTSTVIKWLPMSVQFREVGHQDSYCATEELSELEMNGIYLQINMVSHRLSARAYNSCWNTPTPLVFFSYIYDWTLITWTVYETGIQ